MPSRETYTPEQNGSTFLGDTPIRATREQEPMPTSFLFSVKELLVNEDPSQGGVVPRSNRNGRWYPPLTLNGFVPQQETSIYRWKQGTVSAANRPGDCRMRGGRWQGGDNVPLKQYDSITVFWCNPWTQFMTTPGDITNWALDPEDDKWWPLLFSHDGLLSRIRESGEEQSLIGANVRVSTDHWVNDFGLRSHIQRGDSCTGSLGGNLAILISLIAFTCPPRELDRVLLVERAWREYGWHKHSQLPFHCRDEGMGKVVTIYHDPSNRSGSTPELLSFLEESGRALIR